MNHKANLMESTKVMYQYFWSCFKRLMVPLFYKFGHFCDIVKPENYVRLSILMLLQGNYGQKENKVQKAKSWIRLNFENEI